jgi:DNA-binding CsgD family transcriptional regulator
MTSNGRRPGPKRKDATRPAEPNQASGQAPSGVCRASGDGQRSDWTVAEQFEREGFSYRLLRRPLAPNGLPHLTKREEAVLDLASAGHSNKSIAAVLDVTPSTVGVLVFRAAAKLNVASRSDLLLAYRSLGNGAKPEEPTDSSPDVRLAKPSGGNESEE